MVGTTDKPDAPTLAALGEFGLIDRLFAPLAAGAPGAFGLKDDAAAYLPAPGTELILTKDMLVAGVHFLPDDPPASVGRKLLRVNLSDLAAKGARPMGYLLAAAFAPETTLDWMTQFAEGLAADQAAFGVALWGGDTVRTPGPATFSLTAIGEVAEGAMIRRAGARAGDALFVSGTVGDGALGLAAARGQLSGISADDTAFLADRYRVPQPRTTLGPMLRAIATAAIDVSDGLIADLGHLCEASGVGARIKATRIPLSSAAARLLAADPERIAAILAGGDDYELLFAAPAAQAGDVAAIAREAGVPITLLGEVTDAEYGVDVLDADGQAVQLPGSGYRHF